MAKEEYVTVPLEEGGTTRIQKAVGFEDKDHLTQIANQGGYDIFENSPSDRVFERENITPEEIDDFLEETGL